MINQKPMESLILRNNSNLHALPGPWPWYALLFVGHAISGFFPWLMLAWGLYQRRRTEAAALIFVINFIIFVISGWLLLTFKIPWWQLTVVTYLFNLSWTIAAILYQLKTLGKAAPRYKIRDWKLWIKPIALGIIIGFCFGTIFSIAPAFENRIAMQQMVDTLDRQTVLWDFFQYSLYGVFAGFLLGIWWAGESKYFRASHVITFLSAFVLTILLVYLYWYLISFMVHEGRLTENFHSDNSNWTLFSPWVNGFRSLLIQMETFDFFPLVVIPLLFGAASRIRDFGKRALLIPLMCVCSLPIAFASNAWWEDVQDQIIYDLHSPDTRTQASAYKWANILQVRYPNHQQWPRIAEQLARYNYQIGAFESSRSLYQTIIERYSDSNQWHWCALRAHAALRDPDFGKPSVGPRLEIPMVDYEAFLTHNWMAVLSVVRFWAGAQVPESEIIIKLKNLSKSDDEIKLNPLVSLAEVDDALRNIGFEVFIIPADLSKARALIANGIPVIHANYENFRVLYGIDESRSAVLAYSFNQLSDRLKEESRKDAKEILLMEGEGLGESQRRLARIANEAKIEYSTDYWQSPALRYAGPLMAVVYPKHKSDVIAKALNTPFYKLKAQSDGYLATLIGLAYLHHADPIYAIEWTKIGTKKITDPLPLYAAHLTSVWWGVRDKMIHSTLQLEDQFAELAQIVNYFLSPENTKFLIRARDRFEQDFNDNLIPWVIAHTYTQLLDRSNTNDLNRIKKIIRSKLFYDPASNEDWSFLADTCEWANDIPGTITALKGAVSSNPLDSKTKLRLTCIYATVNQFAKAQAMLAEIDPSKVRYDADYPFCKGAIAEWEGNTKKALKEYEAAIAMRRYKPIYHLRYGRLLIENGKGSQAQKYLKWAARINADESSAKEAAKLLSKINAE